MLEKFSVFMMLLTVAASLVAGAIPRASASLDAIQPIPSQTIDRGTMSVAFPIRVSSSFVDPSDTSDTVRLEIRSNDPLIQFLLGFVPRDVSPFSPNPLQIERSNTIVGEWADVYPEVLLWVLERWVLRL
jgi:hypothetical protein